jgi:hypothetical protein
MRTTLKAAIATMIATVPVFLTSATGAIGCETFGYLKNYSILDGLLDMIFGIPFCNGWLGYLPGIAIFAILYPGWKSYFFAPTWCATIDAALRTMANDEQWAILMPLWKLIPSVLLGIVLTALILRIKKNGRLSSKNTA